MHTCTKATLTGLLAAAILATAISTVSARNLSLSNQNIRAAWASLVFFSSAENRFSCPVTMEGSFHSRTIAKVVGALVGYVRRVDVLEERCAGSGLFAGGRLRANRETLPWHLSYEGFEGVLPRIERVILLLRVDLTIFNLALIGECRYAGNARFWFLPATNELEADRSTAIPRTGGSSFCPASWFFEGKTRVFLAGTVTPVSITLI